MTWSVLVEKKPGAGIEFVEVTAMNEPSARLEAEMICPGCTIIYAEPKRG